ncbi:MAG: LptE family protein [Bacteroidaceae bacterium]
MDWIKRLKAAQSLALLLILLTSCTVSYKFNGASINYDKVKTIAIDHFPIKSAYVYAPLGTVFNDQLQDIFIRQTRLQLVPRNGDLNISGEITNYQQINQAVKADGYSSTTQLRITINVRFVNNTNHTQDFEQQFSAFRDYDSSLMLTSVQDDLIAQMVKEITEQIFNATVANW